MSETEQIDDLKRRLIELSEALDQLETAIRVVKAKINRILEG